MAAAGGIELGVAYISVVPEVSAIAPGVSKALRDADKGAAAAGRDTGEKYGTALAGGTERSARRGQGAVAGFGRSAASAISGVMRVAAPLAGLFAGVSVVGFFGDAIKGASDLEQSLGGVEAVFKGQAGAIKSAAADAAKNLGLSKNAYQELATVLGAGLKNQGIKDFAGETQNLIKIGGDLAAQFGGSTQEAVDALGSAMRGESDPIERYGISLNETAVNAELAARGQSKLEGAALQQAKAQARIAIITRQSADATGAFARESDTLAGKQARMTAAWENFKTTIGTALLPVMSRALDIMSALGGAVVGLFNRLRGGGDSVGRLRAGFDQLAASPVGRWFERLGTAVGALLAPAIRETSAVVMGQLWPALQIVGTALAQAGVAFAGFAAAVARSPVGQFIIRLFRDTILGAVNGVINVFQGLVRVVSGVFDVIAGLVTGDWSRVWGGLKDVVGGAVQGVVGVLQVWLIGRALGVVRAFAGGIGAFFGGILTGIRSVAGPLTRVVVPALAAMGAAVVAAAVQVIKWMSAVGGYINGAFTAAWRGLSGVVSAAWGAVVGAVSGGVQRVRAALSPIAAAIGGAFTAAWRALSAAAVAAWSGITAAASTAWSVLSPIFAGIARVLTAVVGAAFTTLKVVVFATLGAVVLAVQGLWAVVKTVGAGIAAVFRATVVPAFRFFQQVATAVWSAVRDAVTAAWNFLVQRVLTPAWQWFTVRLVNGLNFYRGAAIAVWTAVRNAVTAVWGFLLARVFTPLRNWLVSTFTAALTFFRNTATAVWNRVQGAITAAWSLILGRVFTPLRNWLTGTLTAALGAFRRVAETVWGAVTRTISGAWTRISGTFGSLRDGLKRLWDYFGTVVGGIGRTWDGLKAKVAAPVRYVVNDIIRDKLIAAWNAVAGRVGLGTFNFAGMATGGAVGRQMHGVPRHAAGGRVKGWSPNDTADNILSWLTADEEVIRRRSARRMRRKHPGALEYINRTGSLPGLANGGRVWDSERPGPRMGGRTSPIRGRAPADAGVWRQMATWIKRNLPGARITSSYRRTMTATGKVSNHARGLALDIVGGGRYSMMDVFNAIAGTFGGRSIELIHSQAGGRQISRGRRYYYSGVTRANHFDHVHWSMPSMDPSIPADFSGGGGFSMPNPVAEALKALANPLFTGATKLIDGVSGLFGKNAWVDIVREGTKAPIKGMQQWLVGKIDEKFPALFGGGGDQQPMPAAGTGPVKSQVQSVASKYGWGSGSQWDALQWIIGRESGWNPNAKNPRSSAYGIMQFLSSTWASTGIAKTSNPTLQAEAGMRYIRSRYGTPVGARAFWQRNGYYGEGGPVTDRGRGDRSPQLFDRGGVLWPGEHLVKNATGMPETIRTWEQEQALQSRLGGANITINGIKHDSVAEFAGALDYALIRARNVGRYTNVGR